MKINLSIEADSTKELQTALADLASTVSYAREERVGAATIREEFSEMPELTPAQLDEAQEIIGTPPADAETVETVATPDEPPQIDSAGLPHDERIHAGSKATNKDGTWRRRKGVDDATVELIEAELRGAETPEPAKEPATIAPEAVAPQAEEPAKEPATTPTPSETMRVLTELMRTGTKAPSYLKELSESVGIPAITAIISDTDAHTAVRAKLVEEGLI